MAGMQWTAGRLAGRVALALIALTATGGFRDGPPARVTAGFGEDSCTACHYDDSVPPATGRLTLSGFPDRYTPGQTYRLQLLLEHAGMAVAGFQLAIRYPEDASQAGSLAAPDDEPGRVTIVEEREIQFAQQLLDGSSPDHDVDAEASDDPDLAASPRQAYWRFSWTAPDSSRPVIVHAAALAGDGDESQIGDVVYTLEMQAQAGD